MVTNLIDGKGAVNPYESTHPLFAGFTSEHGPNLNVPFPLLLGVTPPSPTVGCDSSLETSPNRESCDTQQVLNVTKYLSVSLNC